MSDRPLQGEQSGSVNTTMSTGIFFSPLRLLPWLWLMLLASAAIGAAPPATQPARTLLIFTPAGRPAVGALVVVVPNGHRVDILGAHQVDDDPAYKISTTNAAGVATLPPPSPPDRCVVLDDSGFAQLDTKAFATTQAVRLSRWGRVDGNCIVAGKLLTGAKMAAWPYPPPPEVEDLIGLQFATADSQGHFAFDHIPPGRTIISRDVSWSAAGLSAGGEIQRQLVNVPAGQTVHVTHGGAGAQVLGRLILPPSMLQQHDWDFFVCTASSSDEPPLPLPPALKKAPAREQQRWYEQFLTTPAGKAYSAAAWDARVMEQTYQIQLQHDGSFEIDDVAPGQYLLNFDAVSTGDATHRAGDSIMRAEVPVQIPPSAAGQGAAAFRLADIPTRLLPRVPQVGDLAPPINVQTLQGEPLSLAQQRGRYVLIDFWATWCGPCIGEIPNLQAINSRFASNPRFTMISLSCDDDAQTPARYAAQHKLNWTQAYAGKGWESPVMQAYAVRGIPSVWLIGPDGRILAKHLRGDAIQAAVAKALGG